MEQCHIAKQIDRKMIAVHASLRNGTHNRIDSLRQLDAVMRSSTWESCSAVTINRMGLVLNRESTLTRPRNPQSARDGTDLR